MSTQMRRHIIGNLPKLFEAVQLYVPTVEHFMQYMDGQVCPRLLNVKYLASIQVPYDDIGTMSPTQYWAILHPDSSLAGMASLLCSILASQADVERVFSSAKFQSDGRGRWPWTSWPRRFTSG